MKSKIKGFLAFAVILALAGCAAGTENTEKAEVPSAEITGDLNIYAFKIGKADAFFFKTENGTVLLDCGEEDDAEEITDYLNDSGISSLDYLIISHFDKDHVGGAADIIDTIQTGMVLTPAYSEESDEYKAFAEALKNNGLSQTTVDNTYTFTLDDVSFAVLPPQAYDYNTDNDNNSSLVVSIFHGDNSFLFTGDIMDERIAELLSYGDIRHTLIKMPHHGIYSDKLPELVEAVSPQYAIITASDKNPEDDKTTELLDSIGAETYITRNGDISVSSNGKAIKIKQ